MLSTAKVGVGSDSEDGESEGEVDEGHDEEEDEEEEDEDEVEDEDEENNEGSDDGPRWKCNHCTFESKLTSTRCEVCRHGERPRSFKAHIDAKKRNGRT